MMKIKYLSKDNIKICKWQRYEVFEKVLKTIFNCVGLIMIIIIKTNIKTTKRTPKKLMDIKEVKKKSE